MFLYLWYLHIYLLSYLGYREGGSEGIIFSRLDNLICSIHLCLCLKAGGIMFDISMCVCALTVDTFV